MSDHRHHHRQHRPLRLSLPPRETTFITTAAAASGSTPASRAYHPLYPYSSATPTPTPSKNRLSSTSSSSKASKSPVSFLSLLLLLSLRSLYSLLPFLRSSSPSFSLFPFSFLVSLLSFLFSLSFSLFTSSPSKTPFSLKTPHQDPIFSLSSISTSQHKLLVSKSFVLALVFLLRFQALRYCGTAAMILAEVSGNVAARFVFEGRNHGNGFAKSRNDGFLSGFLALFAGLFLLSLSWDRIDCFPFSSNFKDFSVFPKENCVRILPMLLPFLCGFLGCYERVSMNWGTIRQLGRKRVRLISLFYTTVVLFVPAVVTFVMFEGGDDGVSVVNLGWNLANTVVFGVLLSENYSNENVASSKDGRGEFLVTFGCTIVLELFYFPKLSLWGLLLCGLLLYFAVRKLDPVYLNYLELGLESSETFSALVMKPMLHILSERKSRKIALFLLINTCYMIVEFAAGFMSNSLGLISDACHMLFDCAALAIGLYASYISRLPANNQFNYGRGRFEVLSGYVNAVLLVLVGALIVLESFERILDPQEISTNSLLTVSIGGLVVNVVGLIFFHEEHHHAHGGGSCSHSNSHSHSHSHSLSHSNPHSQHHHPHLHHHEDHDCVSVSHDCHEKWTGHNNHHEPHLHGHQKSIDNCKIGGSSCHFHHHTSHCNHDNSAHQHHDHVRDHDHDHVRDHDHDHHGHSHHHHEAHDHDHHHDTNHHAHGSFPQTHTHTHHLDSKSDMSMGNSSSPQRELVSGKEELQKHQHHHIDHNMEGIFLHVLADTMGSVGVVISTLLIKYKGWLVADPASSIFISIMIISSVIPLLRNSSEILLQRFPRVHEQDLKEAVSNVMRIKGVRGIQKLHVWSFTNTDVVGTLQLHVSADTDKASLKSKVSHIFNESGVKDLTVQVESVK